MLKESKVKLPIICICLAFVFITICSTSSPIYPINMWNDSNCFFTVGKAMFDGTVVYAEIYEQKGVLLYFLHGLASLISYDTFMGVWIIEIVSFSIFLFYATKTIELFISDRYAYLFILPVLSALLLTEKSFSLGDSAEEFMLPMYMLFLYNYLLYFTGKAESYTIKDSIVDGVLIGCVFWIKFNLISFFAGFILCIIIHMIRKKFIKYMLMYIGGLVLGILISTMPWVLYFLCNDAISDWIFNYFYANSTLYTSTLSPIGVMAFIKNLFILTVEANGQIMIPGLLGIVFIMLENKVINNSIGRWGFVVSYLLLAIGIWIGGRNSAYYCFAFSVFVLFGLVLCYVGIKATYNNKKFQRSSIVFIVILFICTTVFTYWGTNARNLIGVNKGDIAQYQFAEIINSKKNATLLNYGSLDGGFYTAAGIVPNCKYFCLTNNSGLTEMVEEQNRYVREGITDYVVTCNDFTAPDFMLKNYTLICEKEENIGVGSSIYRLYERNW